MKELYNKKINERSIFKYFLGLLSRISTVFEIRLNTYVCANTRGLYWAK